MKKNTLALVAMLLSAAVATAAPVSRDAASRVAATFLTSVSGQTVRTVTDLTPSTGFTELYVFSSGDNDFVLVAADDCVRPIVGYSLSGSFTAEGMPEHMRQWFDDCQAAIRAARTRQAAMQALGASTSQSVALANEWKLLGEGVAPKPVMQKSQSALLSTQWNQAPYYNDLCPEDENEYDYYGNRVVTGCVATATAQIMKYHNHPTTGYGSHSYDHDVYGTQSADFGETDYDWTHMPSALSGSSSSTQVTAVATLMYHVGVSVEMDYDLAANGGSGAQNYNYMGTLGPSSQTALMQYFKYRPTLFAVGREDMEAEAFDDLLRDELDAERPILFSGRSASGGHSFVIDGYDDLGMFHVNWGWGGSNDGYYPMGGLEPGTSGIGGNSESAYNLSNVVLLGIEPNDDWGTGGTVSATIDGNGGVSGTGTYSFGDTVNLYAFASEGSRFAGWSDGCFFNPREMVMNGGDISLEATFADLDGDTLGYCGHGHYITGLGYSGGSDVYWGIRLPASLFDGSKPLRAVEFYACAAGNYDITVYGGTDYPTTELYTTSATVSTNQTGSWYTVNLDEPLTLDGTQNVWLALHTADANYPASMTYGSGNEDGFLWSSGYYYGGWDQFSFMIRGLMGHSELAQGDTLSYCGNATYETSWKFNIDDFGWGIMLPADEWEGMGNLKSVMLYNDYVGDYSLEVYEGGTDAPQTLVHTQDYTIANQGWNELLLDEPLALSEGKSLWIVLTADSEVEYPASSCLYTGYNNSDWLRYDGDWYHLADQGDDYQYSWMIKAVFAQPEVVSYTVSVSSADPSKGTVSGGGVFDGGSTITVKATPKEHSLFKQWTVSMGGNTLTSTANPYSFTLTADAVCTATFEAEPQYTVSVASADPGMGTVSGGGVGYAGDVVTLTASPKSGYLFDQWHDGNADNPRTVTIAGDATYTAYFKAAEGIDEAEEEKAFVVLQHEGLVTVRATDGSALPMVSLYDVAGRQLGTCSGGAEATFEVPTSGTYLLRIGDFTRRVVSLAK